MDNFEQPNSEPHFWHFAFITKTNKKDGGYTENRAVNEQERGHVSRDVVRGGAEGAAAPPLSLIERFSKDDTTTLKRPKRGKNDVEMP